MLVENSSYCGFTRKMVRKPSSVVGIILAVLVLTSICPRAIAAEDAEAGSLKDALFGGKVDFNLRARIEIADQDTKNTSKALTERIRLGYGSKPYNGLSFYLDFEDIRSANDDLYNAAGLNGRGDKTVVADPEDTELNQAFVKYDWKDASTQIIGGRQRIKLDDDRFIGNVGWRQNEQTFDAVTFKSALDEGVSLLYSFVWDVNRIFGPDSDRDFKSQSHLINLSIDGTPVGKVVVFGYLLDLDNDFAGQTGAFASSSDTIGVRLTGKKDLDGDLALAYILSIAHQVDAGDNPTDYEARYYLIEGKLVHKAGHVGAAYEVLGSDQGMIGFSTPLATGHKFNGWADVFLDTPKEGLQDIYIYAGTKLPGDIVGKVIYHWFNTEEGGGDLGEELDVVLKKVLSKNTTALAKVAYFDGDGLDDRYKFWFQVEFKH